MVVAHHLKLDFHLTEGLAIVDATISGRTVRSCRCVLTTSALRGRCLPCAQAQGGQCCFLRRPGLGHRPPDAGQRIAGPRVETQTRQGSLRKFRCCFCSTSTILSVLPEAL